MPPLTLTAYAKVNLALKIVRRRPDGFHELRTVFERIDLADQLNFLPASSGKILLSCDHKNVPCDGRNLVYRAARLLIEKEGVSQGARIHIRKRIPVAAGLAGGSSDAATALLGLDRLWSLRLPRAKLLYYASLLGSDVAFFLHDRPFALGEGRGERITPLDVPHRFWHVLITPKAPLLTKDVYQLYARRFLNELSPAESRLTRKSDDVTMLTRCLKKGSVAGIQRAVFNDLEGPIGLLRPGLLKLKARLQRITPCGVCFSGSGPSVFAVTQTRKDADRIAGPFRKIYQQVFVVRTA